MMFTSRQAVRFAHIDAAGIVFYPRYFEMLNAAVEDYFSQAVGVDFAQMHMERKLGVPTVRIEADFSAPSRLGDLLDFQLAVANVGRSSLALVVQVYCREERRFGANVSLVCMDLIRGKSVPWPDDMRPDVDIFD